MNDATDDRAGLFADISGRAAAGRDDPFRTVMGTACVVGVFVSAISLITGFMTPGGAALSLIVWIVGTVIWLGPALRERRLPRRSPVESFTGDLDALDPDSLAQLLAADEEYHRRWMAKRRRA